MSTAFIYLIVHTKDRSSLFSFESLHLHATHAPSYTYEIAPVYTLMEEEVLAELRRLVGWSCGDGIFTPGGSLSNLYSLLLARYSLFPEVKKKGLRDLPQMVVFTSEQVSWLALERPAVAEAIL